MKRFSDFKVGVRIFAGCSVLILFTVIVSMQGIVSINNARDTFKTFYNDRFEPVKDLNLIFKGLMQIAINSLQETAAMRSDNLDDFNRRVSVNQGIIDTNNRSWKKYMSTEKVDAETKMADEFSLEYKKLIDICFKLEKENKNKNFKEVLVLQKKWVVAFDKSKNIIHNLINLQERIGEKLYREQQESAKKVFIISISILIFALIIGALITLFLSRSISNPVRMGLEFAEKIADGDLTGRIDLDQSDELGMLGKALNIAADNLESLIANAITGSQNLAQAVDQISVGNQNLSERTSEQASSLEEIAATVEETNASTKQNSENAGEANKLAEESYKMAEEGGRISGDAAAAVNEVNDVSKKINEITGVINDISFQTNLLALNAAVEAARAGEAGRGFAVVAGEIRNLAQRSGSAAKEIAELIGNTVEKIHKGTGLVQKTGESLNGIISSIKNVSSITSEIAAASEEQRQGIEQITISVTEMDTMTQQNAALVEETASASEEMANQAQELLQMTGSFKITGNSADNTRLSAGGNRDYSRRHIEKEKDRSFSVNSPREISENKGSGNELRSLMSEEGFEEF